MGFYSFTGLTWKVNHIFNLTNLEEEKAYWELTHTDEKVVIEAIGESWHLNIVYSIEDTIYILGAPSSQGTLNNTHSAILT